MSLSFCEPSLTADLPMVDSYWAGFLGCEVDLLRTSSVNQLMAMPNQAGLWAISRCGGWVVATPALWGERLYKQIRTCFQPNLLPDSANLDRLLYQTGDQQRYGPAVILLHTHPIAHREVSAKLRPLTLDDHQQVATFGAAMPLPWSLTQPEIWVKVLGLFVADQLVAACGVRVWGDCLAEIYVDTLPTHRRCGYGKAVTRAALQWIYTETPYYPESVVELSNQPSLALMKSLGFESYGYMVMTLPVGQ